MTDKFTFSTYLPVADAAKTKARIEELRSELEQYIAENGDTPRDDWSENYRPVEVLDAFQHLRWDNPHKAQGVLWVVCDTAPFVDELMIVLRELIKLEPETTYFWQIPFAQTELENMTERHFGGGLLLITREQIRSVDQNELFDLARGAGHDLFIETL